MLHKIYSLSSVVVWVKGVLKDVNAGDVNNVSTTQVEQLCQSHTQVSLENQISSKQHPVIFYLKSF